LLALQQNFTQEWTALLDSLTQKKQVGTEGVIVVVSPRVVRIHESTMADIAGIREAAKMVNTKITVKSCDTAVHQWVAAYKDSVCEHASPRRKIKTKPCYQPQKNQADAEKEAISALTNAWEGVPFDPASLPRPVFMILGRNLPSGTLLEFLKKHPRHFSVHEGGLDCLTTH
jgi:hypothetical protein